MPAIKNFPLTKNLSDTFENGFDVFVLSLFVVYRKLLTILLIISKVREIRQSILPNATPDRYHDLHSSVCLHAALPNVLLL